MLLSVTAGLWWPPAFATLLLLLPAALVVRVLDAKRVASVIGEFRLIGPLIGAAVVVRCMANPDTGDVPAPLFESVPALGRLRPSYRGGSHAT